MKKVKALLMGSLIVNLLFIGATGFIVYKQGGISFIKEQIGNAASPQELPDYYLQKKDIFESLNTAKPDKVFIGDSITDHGEFQEYYPGQAVLNRGIAEDTSKGVLNRIDEAAKRYPKEVYLMIGINDIAAGVEADSYRRNIEKIIQSFDENSTKVILQSILPINNQDFNNEISNEKIHQFNKILQEIAEENSLEFVNLHTAFEAPNGQLRKEITIDGIHLKGKGYDIWFEQLSK
ncbi:GDSL-type esterase/lipase family protein [Planococcus shenhongbingii]|uniref:GDSL-type esterase/lipase family protein n=1 Tax=Planococcus shenhongbingii TaxID=3058398 RepID=A0ABT8NAG0_9BACL|nr:GDSL-type esterase/lipase family protein [Planococcus sp. N017]MDN7244535.1 GDSL-type esterase/lipase family protein [Planococcus sp. N017]